MPIRRAADPITVQHVWDAVRFLALHHQTPDTKRIIKYLQRVDKCTPAQGELYVDQAQQDGMIVALPKNGRSGELTDVFRMPLEEFPDLDGKDWYCFECHLAGDVTACRQCFRVYHSDCINGARKKYEEFKKTNNTSFGRYQNQHNNKRIAEDFNTKKNVQQQGNTEDSSAAAAMNSSSQSNDQNVFDGSSNTVDEMVTDSSLNESTTSNSTFNQEPSVNNSNSINTQQGPMISQKKSLINHSNSRNSYDETMCSVCNISSLGISYPLNIEQSELNYLLKFVLHRIRNWLPNTITHTMAEEERPEWLTDKELTWRANQLFFEHKDMSVIEVNINNESYYKHIHEFYADVLTIQHNVAIFHGIESQEYGAAELMVRDCVHDLAELKICVDCYKHSNEKMNPKWFCLPCRIPHKLVWAKQKGYPYWPAKVIRETNTHYDVRFFGGKYERSLLAKMFIKPIDTPREKLQIKTSAAFNKSEEELKFHRLLLENPSELQKLIQSSKPKARTSFKFNRSQNATSKIPTTAGVANRNNRLSTTSQQNNISNHSNDNDESMTALHDSNLSTKNESERNSFDDSRSVSSERGNRASNAASASHEVLKRRHSSYDGNPSNIKRRGGAGSNNEGKRPSTEKLGRSSSSSGGGAAGAATAATSSNKGGGGSDSVIDISDGDDEHAEFSFRDGNFPEVENNSDYNGTYEQVTSSTENFKCNTSDVGGGPLLLPSQIGNDGIQKLDHPYSDSVEKMRRRLEGLTDKGDVIKCAMNCMQAEIDRITNDHNEHLKRLFESHNAQISETKKKQWCYNCEQDAIYHCCWNTAYCSQSCQQQHWQAEHKKVCRRKR